MKPRLLVLYETSVAGLAHGSAHVRLLRPLGYPPVLDRFDVNAAPVYTGQPAEIVVIDRTWRPDVDAEMANALIERIRDGGAKIVYHIDDDPSTPAFGAGQFAAVEVFARRADMLIVSTPALALRMLQYNRRARVVPNALDERLLVPALGRRLPVFAHEPLVIGYMGTFTHDADLRLIVEALRQVGAAATVPLALQIVGVTGDGETWRMLQSLPFPVRRIAPPSQEYPHFLAWFSSQLRWQIGLAPLQETDFNGCKSDVKFLDYAAAGAAGIFSKAPAYVHSVQHGVTGWLAEATVESWRDGLLALIADADLRRTLAANAQRYLLAERTLAQRWADWTVALEEVWHG